MFLTGARLPSSSRRRLATVMITDIVDSTPIASRLGDARWRDPLREHDEPDLAAAPAAPDLLPA